MYLIVVLFMEEYFVYMLTNKYNNVLYVGVTNNINRRVLEHKQKIVFGFTSKYNCTKLVWYEKHEYIEVAIKREKQIKKWLRTWKNELVQKNNPEWLDLSANWYFKNN